LFTLVASLGTYWIIKLIPGLGLLFGIPMKKKKKKRKKKKKHKKKIQKRKKLSSINEKFNTTTTARGKNFVVPFKMMKKDYD
jgi:hypothetical protein